MIKPWTVTIDGMVDKPITLDLDALLAKMPLEERLYRHRCVEAWSMAVPWEGFALAKLVEMASCSQSSAKYVRFESFKRPEQAPGLRQFWYPWPYVEGVTIEEANNELPFLVTGAYGKPLANSMGAPLRLALPWKYGFKSAKGIVRINFTDQQPKTFWGGARGRRNTASGPTSIRRCRIRAGARRASACSALPSACRRNSSMAMPSMSPTSTRAARARSCTCKPRVARHDDARHPAASPDNAGNFSSARAAMRLQDSSRCDRDRW